MPNLKYEYALKMSNNFNQPDIVRMAELLRRCRFGSGESSSSSDEEDFQTRKQNSFGTHASNPRENIPIKKGKEDIFGPIWTDSEDLSDIDNMDYIGDPRPEPGYEIKQFENKSCENIYFGQTLANRSGIIVSVHLSGTQPSEVYWDANSKFLDVRCKKYRLGLHLPVVIDPKTITKEWQNDDILIFTMDAISSE